FLRNTAAKSAWKVHLARAADSRSNFRPFPRRPLPRQRAPLSMFAAAQMSRPYRPTARMPEEFLDAAAFRAETFVRHVEIYKTLRSTNVGAVEFAGDCPVSLPALIAARFQTAGRGRTDNSWWSADGSLTFTAVIEPESFGIRNANWPQLSLATAVAVCEAVAA